MIRINEDQVRVTNIVDVDLGKDHATVLHDVNLKTRPTLLHCHRHDDTFDFAARNRIIAVLILCIVFMIIEIIGGMLSNSTAVMVDAIHMSIDVTTFIMSLAAMYLATKQPTKRLSFGYHRAEVLGALSSVLILWFGTGFLVYMAIGRCVDQSFEVKPNEMIVIASCGVLFNIVMFSVLHTNIGDHSISHHGHSHRNKYEHLEENHGIQTPNSDVLSIEIASPDHQHSHSHSHHKPSKSSNNINVRAAVIHVIGDFVQSVGVLCAAILIKLKPEYKLADPICTFIFSILVLITTITIMRDIVVVLMEGVPSHVNYSGIVDDLLRLPDVRNAHSLHIWSLSTQKVALSVHIAIENEGDSMRVLTEAQEMLRRDHGISRSTIQIEIHDVETVNSLTGYRRSDL
ncbi:unnamed protein product [Adineta ricciae]|uniref:Uncharacterized protein n=1 Tax=Adineta ricciae TaxID=249248 RepID=A0A814FNM0_ADIRI|nr:unnamed protein product [Adineta ricciae]